jgi:hypothetical protein
MRQMYRSPRTAILFKSPNRLCLKDHYSKTGTKGHKKKILT